MGEVDVHVFQHHIAQPGQHSAGAATDAIDLHRTQDSIATVLQPESVAALTHLYP